jgi:hypothetical protein
VNASGFEKVGARLRKTVSKPDLADGSSVRVLGTVPFIEPIEVAPGPVTPLRDLLKRNAISNITRAIDAGLPVFDAGRLEDATSAMSLKSTRAWLVAMNFRLAVGAEIHSLRVHGLPRASATPLARLTSARLPSPVGHSSQRCDPRAPCRSKGRQRRGANNAPSLTPDLTDKNSVLEAVRQPTRRICA